MNPRGNAGPLGRGLASLIPDAALGGEDDAPKLTLRHVPLDEIVPNPEQPREHFDPDELAALADSIREHGILTPLVVRRSEGRYVLIAGERRLRAAGLAGLSEVPVVLREAPGAREQLELALVENLQRADLDAVEMAKGYERLAKDFGLKQDAIAERVGRDRATVANTMRLLKLPDFALESLRDGRISPGHGRALVGLADAPDDLRRVLAKVIAGQLNVRATERLVQQVSGTPRVIRDADRARRERTFEFATKLLREALQTEVEIKPKRKGGTIVLHYGDTEELDRLVQQLRSRS